MVKFEPCWLICSPMCRENLIPILYTYFSCPWISKAAEFMLSWGWMKLLWMTDVPICLEQNSVADVLVKVGLAAMQPATGGSVLQDILIGQVRSWILHLCFSKVCILAQWGLSMISLTDVFCGLFQDCHQCWIAQVYYLLVLWCCVITVLDLWRL